MFGKFEVVSLIGSTKGNYALFNEAEETITNMGYIVLKPVFYNLDHDDTRIPMLTRMCTDKLINADIICVVTPEHVGESTQKRINQAKLFRKKITMWDGKRMIPYWYPRAMWESE